MYLSEDGKHYKISGKDIVKMQHLLEDAISELSMNLVCHDPYNPIKHAKAILTCYSKLKEAYQLSLNVVYLDEMVKEKMEWLKDIEGDDV